MKADMTTLRRNARRRAGLLVLVLGSALGSMLVACSESGQILTAVEKGSGADGSGSNAGASGEGSGGSASEGGSGTGGGAASGGSPESMGGSTESSLVPGPTGTSVRVSAGDVHSCAVFDGELYCWGDNQNGSLGLGNFESMATPMRVGNETDWSLVESGDGSSCGVRAGVVWCWGRGSSGQLGIGQFTSSAVPVVVSLPGGAALLDVGHEHVCTIVDGSALYCWGQNSEGQLGQSDPWPGPGVNSDVPLPVAAGETWQEVSCGQGHTCAIRTDSSLWCWGRNSGGELGLGPDSAEQIREPVRVGSEVGWQDVSAGQNHTCGIRSGTLYCWGDNSSSQLGVAISGFASEPQLVPGVQSAISVSIDTFHTCVIEQGGALLCFGRNIEGQLGDGTIDPKAVPTPAVPEGDWDQISAGRFHTCGVRRGAVLCTGENVLGRLGVGDSERRREFTPTSHYR